MFGPYLPAHLCLSTPRFTRLSLSYQSFFVGLSPTCNTKLSLPPCPCQTVSHIVDTALGERELNPPMRVYQTRVFTSSPPPIARGCSASCSKVLFHTGLLQGIAPIREFPCRHVHSQNSGRDRPLTYCSFRPLSAGKFAPCDSLNKLLHTWQSLA